MNIARRACTHLTGTSTDTKPPGRNDPVSLRSPELNPEPLKMPAEMMGSIAAIQSSRGYPFNRLQVD